MKVRSLQSGDVEALIPLRRKLFTDCEEAQHRVELALLLDMAGRAPGVVGNQGCFIACEGEALLGFAEVQLRSHGEGCWEYTADGTLGIAHLEAWFVDEGARKTGAGRALVTACEDWARAQGSPALASDALLENTVSHAAHAACGFVEVERAVHFRKLL